MYQALRKNGRVIRVRPTQIPTKYGSMHRSVIAQELRNSRGLPGARPYTNSLRQATKAARKGAKAYARSKGVHY